MLAALAVIFVSWITLGVVSIVYTDHVAEQNRRAWCGVLSTLDDAYQGHRPPTALGQQLAVQIHRLRIDSDC